MTAHTADTLTMTGRHLLRLERSLRRTARLDGAMATYQRMLSNPLSRLTAMLDSLASSSLSGPGRTAPPVTWRPSYASPASESPRYQRYTSEAQPAAAEVSRHDTALAQPAHLPIVQSRIGSQTFATSPPQETPVSWPEAYLMSSHTGGRPAARQRKATISMPSDLTSRMARKHEAAPSDVPLSHVFSSPPRGHVMPESRPHITPDDASETALSPLSHSPRLRPGRGRLPSSLPGEDQVRKALPNGGGMRYISPETNDQRRMSQPTTPDMGNVRLSRGGANLLSILRHNLAAGQLPSERQETAFSPGSTPMPEGDDHHSGHTYQASLGNGVRQGSQMPPNDVPDAWGRGEASRQLSPEQIDQIMDTLVEQLEISLLRTYGTSRR
jgi:hypothetical protein